MAVGWDVEEEGDVKCSQGNRDADFGGVFWPLADHSDGVGGVGDNIKGV